MPDDGLVVEFAFDDPPNVDSAIESVLGDNPRASELLQLIAALGQRRAAVLREVTPNRARTCGRKSGPLSLTGATTQSHNKIPSQPCTKN